MSLKLVGFFPLPSLSSLESGLKKVWEEVAVLVQEIYKSIKNAFLEPWQPAVKCMLPAHPVPNTYLKQYKTEKWPQFLDLARDGVQDFYLEGTSGLVEPKEKVTALHAIALGENTRGFFRLAAEGCDVKAKDVRGQTPAYWAAYKGNLPMLMKCKILGADLEGKDARGKAPLRAAAKYNHVDVIDFLVSHKVDLNPRDGRGCTPLHIAAAKGNFSAYQRLVYYGADQTLRDPLGRTAEEILSQKYAQDYHDSWLLTRLFSSKTPPAFSLQGKSVDALRQRVFAT